MLLDTVLSVSLCLYKCIWNEKHDIIWVDHYLHNQERIVMTEDIKNVRGNETESIG